MEIVSCHFKEDLRWLELSPYPVHIVGKEGGDSHLYKGKFASVDVIPNFANEAGSYLWYIASNYERLPESVSFIHGHETSTHQKISIFEAINKYGNLPFVDLNRFMNFYLLLLPNSTFQFVELWNFLLAPTLGRCPKVVNFRGMAQFSVHRDVIRSRSKEFWEGLYEKTRRLCDTPSRTYVMGWFYEATWQLIFGLESPLEDQSRVNLAQIDNFLSHRPAVIDDYVDLFLDSSLKIYGPWEFMKKLAEMDS